jgi:dienelactone hydrolase
MRRAGAAAAVALRLALTASSASGAPVADRLAAPWPSPDSVSGRAGQSVEFPSHSPFVPADIGGGPRRDPATTGQGILFLPESASPAAPVPAVILLHGSSGVQEAREINYGRQLAAMGVAVLVVDSFGARRDRGTGFVDRLLNITETMLVADAYAGLDYLAGRGDVDPRRVVLIGYSYGAMAAVYAAYQQLARPLSPHGLRFAGHVAFYGPCIARFAEPRTTGAPVLLLYGGRDTTTDPKRCGEIADDLRAGGSTVATITYPDAVHQWDGGFDETRPIGRDLTPCSFTVERDGTVRDDNTWLAMSGPLTRKTILWLCVADKPYMIGRNDSVRERSNHDLGAFLSRVFAR